VPCNVGPSCPEAPSASLEKDWSFRQSRHLRDTKLSKQQRILLGNIILCLYGKYFARYQCPAGAGRYCEMFDMSLSLQAADAPHGIDA